MPHALIGDPMLLLLAWAVERGAPTGALAHGRAGLALQVALAALLLGVRPATRASWC